MNRRTLLKSIPVASVPLAGCITSNGNGSQLPETIDFIIPSSAGGGGFDSYGRITAQSLEEVLSESSVVPKNVASGHGVQGLNEIYNGDSRGSVLGIAGIPAHMVTQLNYSGVEFDMRQMSYVGQVCGVNKGVIVAQDESDVDSWQSFLEAARTRRVTIAVNGAGSSEHTVIKTIKQNQNLTELDIVTSTTGSSESQAAFRRGDVELIVVSPRTYKLLREPDGPGAKIPFLLAPPDTTIPDELGVGDVDIRANQENVSDILYPILSLFCTVVGPKDLEETMLEKYRPALGDAMDLQLVEDWQKKTELGISYKNGAEYRESGFIEDTWNLVKKNVDE